MRKPNFTMSRDGVARTTMRIEIRLTKEEWTALEEAERQQHDPRASAKAGARHELTCLIDMFSS